MSLSVRAAPAVALIALVAACTAPPASPTASTSAALEDCGAEETVHGTGYNADGRPCLLDAFEAGSLATFVSDAVTVEGAPIRRTCRVLGPELVEIEHDARQDPLGSGRIEILRCPRLVVVAEWNRLQGGDLPQEIVFVEDGCELIGG
ncbi:MAG: hypothetical protein ABR509_00900 [Candidatus Limnocylindria bacterium]